LVSLLWLNLTILLINQYGIRMTYLEKLRQENEENRKLYMWADNRKQLVHKVSIFYSSKGLDFARDLEKLLNRYEKRPDIKGSELYTEIRKSKSL
jgi:hypothetical protein